MREARPFRIYDGPSEVYRMVITRHVLKAAHDQSAAGGALGGGLRDEGGAQ